MSIPPEKSELFESLRVEYQGIMRWHGLVQGIQVLFAAGIFSVQFFYFRALYATVLSIRNDGTVLEDIILVLIPIAALVTWFFAYMLWGIINGIVDANMWRGAEIENDLGLRGAFFALNIRQSGMAYEWGLQTWTPGRMVDIFLTTLSWVWTFLHFTAMMHLVGWLK